MKALILGMIIGIAGGYAWGYGDAAADKAHVARRVMVKFGAATVERSNRRMDAAIDSTGR